MSITDRHLTEVAKSIKRDLDKRAFLTLDRTDLTERLRAISGQASTRIKPTMGERLERALLEQGVSVYPSISETTTGDIIRFSHTPSLFADLTRMVARPDKTDDTKLGEYISKIKL